MKRLIINADGYGFTPGVNQGIVETFKHGLVTSTSCSPNFGYLGDAGKVQADFPNISFGIHVNLSVGRPVLPAGKVPSLVNRQGEFWGNQLLRRVLLGMIRMEDCVREMSAQTALLADQGVKVSHIDGHQNKHLYPVYFDAVLEIARLFSIPAIRCHKRLLYTNSGPLCASDRGAYYRIHPARWFTHQIGRRRTDRAKAAGLKVADRLITPGYADTSHKSHSQFWKVLAETLPAGTSEVYCHPGVPDDLLRQNAKYAEQRLDEMKILSDPGLLSHYRSHGIELINFHEL